MPVAASTPIELIEDVYSTLDKRVGAARERFGRELTPAEKILVNHLNDATVTPERGATDWYQARRRAHAGTTPGLTGPNISPWRRAWALGDRSRRQHRRWP